MSLAAKPNPAASAVMAQVLASHGIKATNPNANLQTPLTPSAPFAAPAPLE